MSRVTWYAYRRTDPYLSPAHQVTLDSHFVTDAVDAMSGDPEERQSFLDEYDVTTMCHHGRSSLPSTRSSSARKGSRARLPSKSAVEISRLRKMNEDLQRRVSAAEAEVKGVRNALRRAAQESETLHEMMQDSRK